jgi:transposase InsO family protein
VTLSVGRKGQCWDNAVAESFFATIKTELIHRRAWPTRKAATSAIFDYIEGWYNTRRRHSTPRLPQPRHSTNPPSWSRPSR